MLVFPFMASSLEVKAAPPDFTGGAGGRSGGDGVGRGAHGGLDRAADRISMHSLSF